MVYIKSRKTIILSSNDYLLKALEKSTGFEVVPFKEFIKGAGKNEIYFAITDNKSKPNVINYVVISAKDLNQVSAIKLPHYSFSNEYDIKGVVKELKHDIVTNGIVPIIYFDNLNEPSVKDYEALKDEIELLTGRTKKGYQETSFSFPDFLSIIENAAKGYISDAEKSQKIVAGINSVKRLLGKINDITADNNYDKNRIKITEICNNTKKIIEKMRDIESIFDGLG